MFPTSKHYTEQSITVDINALTEMLGCGYVTARAIGEQAGAKIKIGHRVLYKVDRIERYLDEQADEQAK